MSNETREDKRRFSDAQLLHLREEFEGHKQLQDERWTELADMVRKNTEAVELMAKSTEGVVKLYEDLQGAARVGVGLRKLLVWLTATGTAGASISAGVWYLIEILTRPPAGG